MGTLDFLNEPDTPLPSASPLRSVIRPAARSGSNGLAPKSLFGIVFVVVLLANLVSYWIVWEVAAFRMRHAMDDAQQQMQQMQQRLR